MKSATYQFRVSLAPKLYRELEISSSAKLYDLADAIVRAFGFDFDHAFGFYNKLKGFVLDSPVRYELFADMGEADEGSRSVERTAIAEAFPKVGSKMTFLFDYGDDWQFRVELVGRSEKQRGAAYPRVLKSVGKAPVQYPDPDEDAA